MTLEEAKQLKAGDYVWSENVYGKPAKLRVTSVKTWKREPNRIEVRTKYGLFVYPKFFAGTLNLIRKHQERI
jgi:hypothetical protein